MYAARFGLYLGHPQACQYRNSAKEDVIRIQGASCLQSLFFAMLKQNIKCESKIPK
jgi:hypothetical protein